MTGLKIILTGSVQNVGLRINTKREADRIGLSGSVRNLSDHNQVKIKVFGEPSRIKSLLDWLEQGPKAEQIAKIETKEIPDEDYNQFIIEY